MKENIVYVIQEIPGTQSGNPKINIMGASNYGKLKFLLPEFSQIIFSPGPLIFKLRKNLKDFKLGDYLLLTGDPAIIGVACSIVSDITNGKYNLLKWDNKKENIILLKLIYTRKEKLMIDFEKDQQNTMKKTDNIQSLADQVEKLESLQKKLELQEENMKNTKKQLEHVSGEVIPTMMSEMGLSHLKLMDGSSVDVKPNYSASISVANKEKAFNWLRNNGLGDIIKNEISVSFGRNEDNKAADYAALAEERGFQPTQKLKVEPMTLKALVRERIEAGKEMPTEIFNVFVGNKTTIKRKQ